MKFKVAVSEDLLWTSDSNRCSGRFEANLGLEYDRHSVIMCLTVRLVPHVGHNGGSFLFILSDFVSLNYKYYF